MSEHTARLIEAWRTLARPKWPEPYWVLLNGLDPNDRLAAPLFMQHGIPVRWVPDTEPPGE